MNVEEVLKYHESVMNNPQQQQQLLLLVFHALNMRLKNPTQHKQVIMIEIVCELIGIVECFVVHH